MVTRNLLKLLPICCVLFALAAEQITDQTVENETNVTLTAALLVHRWPDTADMT